MPVTFGNLGCHNCKFYIDGCTIHQIVQPDPLYQNLI